MTNETSVENVLAQIQTEYSKGINSDSSQLSYRYAYSKALTIRAKLISQKAKNKQRISDNCYISLHCVKMIKVEASTCPFILPSGYTATRSEKRLPKGVSDYNEDLIKRVGTVIPLQGKMTDFSPTTKEKLKYHTGLKYTGTNNKKYLIEDGYLYLYADVCPMYLEVTMVPYDPYEAEIFNAVSCETGICFSPFDVDFRIDSDIINTLAVMTAELIINIFRSDGRRGHGHRRDRDQDGQDQNQEVNEEEA